MFTWLQCWSVRMCTMDESGRGAATEWQQRGWETNILVCRRSSEFACEVAASRQVTLAILDCADSSCTPACTATSDLLQVRALDTITFSCAFAAAASSCLTGTHETALL